MLNVFGFIFFIVFSLNVLDAQRKPILPDRQMGKDVEIKMPSAVTKCPHCERAIAHFIIREKGVLSYNIDMRSKILKIFYAHEMTNPNILRTAVANAGYQADTVSPEPSSFNLLPVCCKARIVPSLIARLKDQERQRAKQLKKRYRPPRQFLCCEFCDYYYKYEVLKDTVLGHWPR